MFLLLYKQRDREEENVNFIIIIVELWLQKITSLISLVMPEELDSLSKGLFRRHPVTGIIMGNAQATCFQA